MTTSPPQPFAPSSARRARIEGSLDTALRAYSGRTDVALVAAIVLAMLAGCSDNDNNDDISGGGGAGGPSLPGPSRCGAVDQRPWCDKRLNASERSDLLLARMTLTQKVGLMAGDDLAGVATGEPATGTSNGVAEAGIPVLYMSDGPVGPRERLATAFPSPLALAASFNPELAYRVGKTISNEVRLKGNDLVHAPTVDVVRVALAGRTFETYGEDPYLSSRFAPEWVKGAQSEGVIANVKHYALNTQEGQVGAPPLASVIGPRHLINAMVDERTLREIHLPPFETAIKEGDAGSVMCSYNIVNNSPACSSAHLLQEILRNEWGFDGFVLSDYVLAVKDTVMSANNGTEIEMPIPVFYTPLLLEAAVLVGLVSAETMDERVGNILRTLFRFGFFDRAPFPSDDSLIDQAAHATVARENLEQGIVLLQNDGVLPLDASALDSIAIIGTVAQTYVNGGGSSAVKPFEFKPPRAAIADRAGPGVEVSFNPGENATSAAIAAAAADVALVFVRDNATEGTDKNCLSLNCTPIPGIAGPQPQEDLIRAVAAANPRTVVIMETGGPVLTPWRGAVAAVLEAWYPGQEAGPAIARVLFGDVDASGRLPLSFMNAEGDTPVAGNPFQYPGVANIAQYSEGVFIGYRWHDQNEVAPAFPFGHGLSYTTFRYSGLSVGPTQVSVSVTNTGERRGVAIPQLYLGLPSPRADVPQPPRQLKGFARLDLTPGQSRRVSFALDERAISYWDVVAGEWQVAPGCYRVEVGSSSRDLPLSDSFAMGGAGCS